MVITEKKNNRLAGKKPLGDNVNFFNFLHKLDGTQLNKLFSIYVSLLNNVLRNLINKYVTKSFVTSDWYAPFRYVVNTIFKNYQIYVLDFTFLVSLGPGQAKHIVGPQRKCMDSVKRWAQRWNQSSDVA